MTSPRVAARHHARGSARTLCWALALAACTAPAAAVPVTYTETVFNTTFFDWSQIGLGSLRFDHAYTYLTFTFSGDTDNVRSYQVNQTHGYLIDQGTASVRIRDVTNNVTVTATFDAGEVYVGTDIENGGFGFGSRIYPVYPYGLFATLSDDLSDPAFDLRHDLAPAGLRYGISCISLALNCVNRTAAEAQNHGLHTDQGDFWVTWQGVTAAAFSVQTQPGTVPEPTALLLALSALAALAVRRRT